MLKKKVNYRKKILFIALAHSSHTHAWLDLLKDSQFEVRIFGINNTNANGKLKYFQYNFDKHFPFIEPMKLQWWHLKYQRFIKERVYKKINIDALEKKWLSWIINRWKPDIVHLLGINPCAIYYWQVKSSYQILPKFCLVLTLRGGSDLELERFNKLKKPLFKDIFQKSDYVIADNDTTYRYASELGLDEAKKALFGYMPGAGGVDAQKLSALRSRPATESRIILWPKAYESIYSKGLSVLEALKISWDKISPCKVVMIPQSEEICRWLAACPAKMRKNFQSFSGLDPQELLKIMSKSRVVLIPSLIDGVPNTLYEAMATKTFPIVSPLPTIKTLINSQNTIFARNLYPHEIARALIRAMTDDRFIKKVIDKNFIKVQKIANRQNNRIKLQKFYDEII